MERQNIIETDADKKETEREVHFVFLVGQQHGCPESIKEALYGPEREKWTIRRQLTK
jgi:hypothetical protein